MKIYALSISEPIEKNELDKFINYLPDEKIKRIRQYKKDEDFKRSLMSEVLIRSIIHNELNLHNSEIIFQLNDFGKPSLKGCTNFHFNCAHSGDWVVCAMDAQTIGIDIEKIRPMDVEVAKQVFSDEEFDLFTYKTTNGRQDLFYDLWTMKESYIKAVGEGLSIPLNSFSISFTAENSAIIKAGSNPAEWLLRKYDLDEDYKMAVCSKNHEFCEKIIIKTYREVVL